MIREKRMTKNSVSREERPFFALSCIFVSDCYFDMYLDQVNPNLRIYCVLMSGKERSHLLSWNKDKMHILIIVRDCKEVSLLRECLEVKRHLRDKSRCGVSSFSQTQGYSRNNLLKERVSLVSSSLPTVPWIVLDRRGTRKEQDSESDFFERLDRSLSSLFIGLWSQNDPLLLSLSPPSSQDDRSLLEKWMMQ
jgi:hypothetical protein